MVAIGLLAVPAAAVRMQHTTDASAQPTFPDKPAAPKPPASSATPVSEVRTQDPRAVRLAKFFSELHCPIRTLAEDFIHAADENHLDWRLLPSISVIESGGGKAYKNNNIFGWNNGAELFPSIRHGIREVAFKLGRSPLYRRSNTAGKLHTYNSDESYVDSVLGVMNRISPEVNLNPVSHLARREASRGYEFQKD